MQQEIPVFIADVHLGKLARLLRMLGFDTVYRNNFSKVELADIAQEQNRVLLSRDPAIGKHHSQVITFLINHDNPEAQLATLLQYFQLLEYMQPFTRCMVCNSLLEPVLKEDFISELPEKTALYYNEFWHCTNCHRIYWKGPHYNRMMKFVERVRDIE